MKIRIKGNTLRYRITKSEVTKLWTEGFLDERTEFTGNTLTYSIVAVSESVLKADFTENKIALYMPNAMVDELYKTERVGFADITGPVHLLVEKDFACIDNVDEDQSDNYPNPMLNC